MSLPYVGNYSLQPGQVIPIPYLESNSKKRYLIGVQKGKPVLDEELSEAGFREFDLVCKYLERNVGTAALGANSFKIIESATTTVSNFSITGGTADDPAILVVKGYPTLLFSTIEYNQQDATGSLTDDDYTKTLIPGISVPVTDRIDAVYIDIYLAEVSSEVGSEYQDTTLKDPILAIQTANRFRIVQDILVNEGNTTIPSDGLDINGIYHRYYKLAEIQRHTGVANIYNADITDMRNVVTSLKDISNGTGDIHVNNATVDNDLTVHGTVTIINTAETNAESMVITSDDAGVNALTINKTNTGHALIINKSGGDHALIVNAGNSGFGTNNPADKVTIYQGRLRLIGSYTGTPVIQLTGEDAAAGVLRTTNAVPLFLGANNVTRISLSPTTATVGIATEIPDATVALDINGLLRIRSGAPGIGKLLQSDANGVGSWVEQNLISDDDWEKSGNNVTFNKPGGMVGIQTTVPSSAALDVNGLIRMRSGASAGNIIMSDANGVFSWVTPSTISDGDWVLTDTRMYNATATVVGIGTNNPNPALGRLQVNGAIYTNSGISCASVSSAGAVSGNTGSFSGNLTANDSLIKKYVSGYSQSVTPSGEWYPVAKISITSQYGFAAATILLSLNGGTSGGGSSGISTVNIRAKQQDVMSVPFQFIEVFAPYVSGVFSSSDIVFVVTTDNSSLKEGSLFVRINKGFSSLNYTVINASGNIEITAANSPTQPSLPGGTQYQAISGQYVDQSGVTNFYNNITTSSSIFAFGGINAGAHDITTTGTISGGRLVSSSTVSASMFSGTNAHILGTADAATLDGYVFHGGAGNIYTHGDEWSVGIGTSRPGYNYNLENQIMLDINDWSTNFPCSLGIKRNDYVNNKFYILCQRGGVPTPGTDTFYVRSDGQCYASEFIAGASNFAGVGETTTFKTHNQGGGYTFATANVDNLSLDHVQDVNIFAGHQATGTGGGGLWVHDYTGSAWAAVHAGIFYAADGYFIANYGTTNFNINNSQTWLKAEDYDTFPYAMNVNFYVGDAGTVSGGIWCHDHTGIGYVKITASAFHVGSDIRLKENIVDISNAVNVISQLRGVEFSWKNDERRNYGFIAQEVEKVIPSAVSISDHNGLKDLRTMDSGKIIPFVVESIKSLKSDIDRLKLAVGIA